LKRTLKDPAALKISYSAQDRIVSQLSDQERETSGVTARLPGDVDQAREALRKDEKLTQALGHDFVEGYLLMNQTLNEQMNTGSPESDLKLLLETY